ncbi:hypothetical protein SNE40_009712 [Patella caerulea]|uniref:CCHC-type domain-containing protein n=1 Tax=Patella caerulea TaxID=87958 RepID=A0AAN8JQ55_PATCE
MDPIVKVYQVPEEETSRISYHVAVSSTDRLTHRGILKCLTDLLGKSDDILTIYLKGDERKNERTEEVKYKLLEKETHTLMGTTYNFHKRFSKVVTLTVYDFPVSYSKNDKEKDIPQVIILKAHYGDARVRVVTPGQPSSCFRCEKVGHSRKECPLRGPEKKKQTVPKVLPPVQNSKPPVPGAKKSVIKTVTQSPPAEPKAPKRRREDGTRSTSETAEFKFAKPRPLPIRINENSFEIYECSYHPSTTPHDNSAYRNNYSICSIHSIPTTPTTFD